METEKITPLNIIGFFMLIVATAVCVFDFNNGYTTNGIIGLGAIGVSMYITLS